MWTRGNPLISSLPHLLLYLLVSFTFPLLFLTRFIYLLAFPSLPILP